MLADHGERGDRRPTRLGHGQPRAARRASRRHVDDAKRRAKLLGVALAGLVGAADEGFDLAARRDGELELATTVRFGGGSDGVDGAHVERAPVADRAADRIIHPHDGEALTAGGRGDIDDWGVRARDALWRVARAIAVEASRVNVPAVDPHQDGAVMVCAQIERRRIRRPCFGRGRRLGLAGFVITRSGGERHKSGDERGTTHHIYDTALGDVTNRATDRATWLRRRDDRMGATTRGSTNQGRRRTRSLHVPMRDGVNIAIDVHLPAEADGPLPTIVRQTRYFRGIALKEPFRRFPFATWLLDHAAKTRHRFLANGYAWVDVCVRGSGASYGSRACPWAPEEIADGADIVDWIVAQPWSNGLVGSTGVSYDGTTAEFLLVNNHPAVRAIAPRFSLYDVFTDVAFPGGIHLDWFTEAWSTFNRALDENAFDRAFALMLRVQLRAVRALPLSRELDVLLSIVDSDVAQAWAARALRWVASGVRQVDDDDGSLLRAAIDAHRDNFDVHQGALEVDCRDDSGVSDRYPEATIDFFSPHSYARELESSGAAILGYSGWLDAAYQHGAIKRFAAVKNPQSQLLVGPWDHGGVHNISPFSPSSKTAFDQDGQLIAFFDRELKGVSNGNDPAVRYFTIGEEAWKSADSWPPPGVEQERWYFGDARSLRPHKPNGAGGVDEYRVDPDVGTGRRSRWDSLLGLLPPVGYSGRAELGRRMLVYRSTPLDAALEVTGHPIVRLFVRATERDAHIFVYLEDEHPDGHVDYVTEGQLRAAHRRMPRTYHRADLMPLDHGEVAEVTLDLLPISWLFQPGHRLRLAVSGADKDHFRAFDGRPTLAVERSREHPSSIALPVMRR